MGIRTKERRYNDFWRRFNMEKNFPQITGHKIGIFLMIKDRTESSKVAARIPRAIKNHMLKLQKSFEELAEAA